MNETRLENLKNAVSLLRLTENPGALGVDVDLLTEILYCPNEQWECTKIQRRLESLLQESQTLLAAEKAKSERLLEALKFYADGKSFEYCGKDEWEPEDVSGEPVNWLCGGAEGGEFQYEDGWVAREAIAEYNTPELPVSDLEEKV